MAQGRGGEEELKRQGFIFMFVFEGDGSFFCTSIWRFGLFTPYFSSVQIRLGPPDPLHFDTGVKIHC